MIEKYSLCLNELLRAACPYSQDVMYASNAAVRRIGAFTCPPFGPAVLFKFVPDEFVRKNRRAINQHCLPYFP
jgi:hypothetical protein